MPKPRGVGHLLLMVPSLNQVDRPRWKLPALDQKQLWPLSAPLGDWELQLKLEKFAEWIEL
jgi:hypothetical protein